MSPSVGTPGSGSPDVFSKWPRVQGQPPLTVATPEASSNSLCDSDRVALCRFHWRDQGATLLRYQNQTAQALGDSDTRIHYSSFLLSRFLARPPVA